MTRSPSLLLAVILLGAAACASMQRDPMRNRGYEGVVVEFSHFGSGVDPWQLRIAETGEEDRSTRPGSDVWLRLRNDSPHTMAVETRSIYISRPLELVPSGPRTKVAAIADGSEVSVIFWSKAGPYAAGDFRSVSFLPGNRSLLFNVPRELLRRGRSIGVPFEILSDAVLRDEAEPAEYWTYFSASDLPEP